ncbi:hypothetical protein MWU54_00145 [Marivita sp. S6314]|uniref:hypothetical protein n=1 Tax=Marivita sp. S6314 TaxID=2926406 RepID=UPI001FF5518C|nr:hypothetical protein [Marivita sp. S6314]MCK0148420.1 hypothetical protein [Marivita sp. S6314]
MPITVDILPEHNLVFVRYTGVMLVQESAEAFAAFAQNPDARPGLRHLVDMTRLTDIDRDFPKFMELQAAKIETLASTGVETFMVYLATTPIGRQAANIGKNGWTPESGVVAIVQDSEEAALEALGIPHRSIAEMLNDGAAESA